MGSISVPPPVGADYLNLNLKMVRGNNTSFNIQVVQGGSALNCTSGTLRMTAKWKPTDADVNEVFSVYSPANGITWTSAAGGLATITIAPGLTSSLPYHQVNLPYDIQYTDASSNPVTVGYGTLTVLPNISRTTP